MSKQHKTKPIKNRAIIYGNNTGRFTPNNLGFNS